MPHRESKKMTEEQQGPTLGVPVREVSLLSIHSRKPASREEEQILFTTCISSSSPRPE